jgi:hypothetical protein
MDSSILYGALAEDLVRHAVDAWMHPKPPRTARAGEPEPLRAVAGSRFMDHALSAFGRAGVMLVRLGLAHVIDRDGAAVPDRCAQSMYTGWFALTVDGDKVAALMTERASLGQFEMPPIGEVLAVWLACADHMGVVSTGREPFRAHDDAQKVMRELALSGYATWRGKQFLWTDEIGFAMQSANFWDDRNRTFEEVTRLQIEAELRDAATSIPEDIRLAVLEGDVQSVREALLNRWIDDAWRLEAEPGTHNRRLGTVVNARRLMALVFDSAKPAGDD